MSVVQKKAGCLAGSVIMHLLLLVSHSGTSPADAVLVLSAVEASPEITKLDLQASLG